jgi:hypothetical protein
MKYRFSGPPRICDRPECKQEFKPRAHNQRFCSLACKSSQAMADFKTRNPKYWDNYQTEKRLNATKKLPKPPYNSKLCSYCNKPLGRTFNVLRHKACQEKASHLEGMEIYAVYSVKRNGHYAPN